MLYTAVNDVKGPVALRYPRGNATGLQLREGFESVPIGKASLSGKATTSLSSPSATWSHILSRQRNCCRTQASMPR